MIHQQDITDLMADVATFVSADRDNVESLSLVEMIAELRTIKNVRATFTAPADSLKEMQDAMEARILAAMREAGQTLVGGDVDKVAITEKTRLQIGAGGVIQYKTEIDQLVADGKITTYEAMALFPASVNATGYKDFVERTGISLACVEEVVVESISLRKK